EASQAGWSGGRTRSQPQMRRLLGRLLLLARDTRTKYWVPGVVGKPPRTTVKVDGWPYPAQPTRFIVVPQGPSYTMNPLFVELALYKLMTVSLEVAVKMNQMSRWSV